ncbi:nucleolar protein 9-like [Ornithodoros turicata]|uniref:nucleolar protein 9-like n=1 Tax=Ornithodoros turicata TaxID=34597 RepID=UPI0031397F84
MSYNQDYSKQGSSGYRHLGFRNRGRGGFKQTFRNSGGHGSYSPDYQRGAGPPRRQMHYGRGGRGSAGFRHDKVWGSGYRDNSGFSSNYHRGSYRGRDVSHTQGIGVGAEKGQKLDRETEEYFAKVNTRFKSDFEDEEDRTVFLANVGEQTVNKELELARNRSASFCIQMLLSQTKDPSVLTRFMTVFSDDLRMVCTHFAISHVTQTLLQAGLKYLQCPSSYTVNEEEDMASQEEPGDSGEDATEDAENEECVAHDETTDDTLEGTEDDDGKEGKIAMDALLNHDEKVKFWTLRVGRFCLNNLKEFMFNPLACHVTRTVIQVLGGCMVDDEIMRNKKAKQCDWGVETAEACEPTGETYDVPEEFVVLLHQFVSAFMEDTDLASVMKSSMASPLLQTLLAIFHSKDKEALVSLLDYIGNFIFSGSSGESGFPPALSDTSASYVVEKLFKYGPPEYISKVWKEHLQGHLLKMAIHPVANFCAQRLLESVSTLDEFHNMYEELAPGFDSLMMCRNTTVLVCIAEACKRLSTYQSKFITKLQETLNCASPEERKHLLVPLTLYMMTYGDFERAGAHIGIVHQGALIIQHTLHFQKPTKVVNSLLAMTAEELTALACCPKGSHVIDAFIMSPSVTVQQRGQFVSKMKGHFYDVATDKYGSLVIDNFWKMATLAQKVEVAEELSQKEHLLTASVYGSFVARKCAVYHFKHRRNEWTQVQTAKEKTAELFQDILE